MAYISRFYSEGSFCFYAVKYWLRVYKPCTHLASVLTVWSDVWFLSVWAQRPGGLLRAPHIFNLSTSADGNAIPKFLKTCVCVSWWMQDKLTVFYSPLKSHVVKLGLRKRVGAEWG